MFEIYGVDINALNTKKWINNEKQGDFLGKYDGIEFISDKHNIKQLEEYDYLHIYVDGNIKSHSPRKYNKNIEDKLKQLYTSHFGEVVQTSLL